METLDVGPNGELTLTEEMLRHLGVAPGDDVDAEVRGGVLILRAVKRDETREISE